MNNKILIITLPIILGVIFIALGFEYATHQANQLPSWLPGHDVSLTKVHTKHAIASFVLAVASFVVAWFQAGPKKSSEPAK